jgi:hypothetical protein
MEYVVRFDCGKIEELADRYTSCQSEADRNAEAHIEEVIAPSVKERLLHQSSFSGPVPLENSPFPTAMRRK